MKNQHVLISGPAIAADEELIHEIEKTATASTNFDNQRLITIIAEKQVDLLLLEVPRCTLSQIQIIAQIRRRYPNLPILLVDGNGDRELIAAALGNGVNDAFRKPYKICLIVERVRTFLNDLAKSEMVSCHGP